LEDICDGYFVKSVIPVVPLGGRYAIMRASNGLVDDDNLT
jgi:hypothetical protein